MMLRAMTALRTAVKKFRNAREGNVAMMFAIAAIPLIVAVGAVVDYSRAYRARSQMQDALDATALALSQSAATMSQTQLQTQSTAYFNANFTNPDAQNMTLTPTYSSVGPTLTVAGQSSVKSYFLGLVGLKSLPISASSTVVWGQQRLRVALVLDNTGSMADDGKITALKTASHNLLTQLKNAASVDGDVYVSIIPFSKDVNVGPSNYSQSWVRWDLWNEVNGDCSGRTSYSTKTACENAGRTWTVDAHNTWNGCVTDRDQSYDIQNTAPATGTIGTLFPAEEYSYCTQGSMMGLSYNWTALNNLIDTMQPNGSTNQAIGLQWGWQSLTQAPFTIPPYDANYKYQQIIILLSDGLNTQDRWYGNGSDPSSQVDARQKTLCTSVKTAGVTVYAIQVDTGGDPKSTLLQNCASGTDKFFLLTSANQIVTTFQAIGTALSNLRVSM